MRVSLLSVGVDFVFMGYMRRKCANVQDKVPSLCYAESTGVQGDCHDPEQLLTTTGSYSVFASYGIVRNLQWSINTFCVIPGRVSAVKCYI